MKGLDEFVENIGKDLGQDLVCVATYGWNDEQVLAVVSDFEYNVFMRVNNSVKKFFKKSGTLPMFLTEEELTGGIDVFPLEFLNMNLHHKILTGKDMFTPLTFKKEHIRRELEFEFRSKLINLRQGVLEVGDSKKDLNTIISTAVPTLLPILNGLLFLKDVPIHNTLPEIFEAVSREYEVDMDVFSRIEEAKGKKLSGEELRQRIQELMHFLGELGEILDEMVL